MIRKPNKLYINPEVVEDLPQELREVILTGTGEKISSAKIILANLIEYSNFKYAKKIEGENVFIIYEPEKKLYKFVSSAAFKDRVMGFFHSARVYKLLLQKDVKGISELLPTSCISVTRDQINPKKLILFTERFCKKNKDFPILVQIIYSNFQSSLDA